MARLEKGFRWDEEFGEKPFFEGEVEPCINGGTLALGAYFGRPTESLALRLVGEQLDDGGWNCEAPKSARSSFHTTICVLEGLLEYERAGGSAPEIAAARRRGEEYLLERGLFRRRSTGEVATPAFLELAFPPRYHYDVLRALDYFRNAGVRPDARIGDAVHLEIEILLHHSVQVSLGVIGCGTDGAEIENRSARFLNDEYLYRNRLQFWMCGPNERFGTASSTAVGVDLSAYLPQNVIRAGSRIGPLARAEAWCRWTFVIRRKPNRLGCRSPPEDERTNTSH